MLNEFQQASFQQEARELEAQKREEGYLDMDLVALGYYLIQHNIQAAENMEQMLTNTTDLISRADALIQEVKDTLILHACCTSTPSGSYKAAVSRAPLHTVCNSCGVHITQDMELRDRHHKPEKESL